MPWSVLTRLPAELTVAVSEVLNGGAAERVLDAFLRTHRGLTSEERAVVAESIFGVGLWRRRLAWQLGGDDARAFEPGLLIRSLIRDVAGVEVSDSAGLPPPRGLPESWRIRESFPDWLADHLERELGVEEAAAFAAAVNVPGPVTVRVGKGSREEVAASLAADGIATRPTRWAKSGLVVETARANLTGSKAHRAAAFEPQDEGSQLVGALVEARPGMRALDYCAGAGGKTLQLASDVGNSGEVHAWDVELVRLERLRVRARNAGAFSVRIHREVPPASLSVDAVLVDAPCSEIGPIRRGPDSRWRIDPAELTRLPAVQLGILEAAQRHVRVGGRIVYATCTINRSENEGVVAAFEAGHPRFARVAPDAASEFVDGEKFFRALPHRHGTDGFFAAVFELRE